MQFQYRKRYEITCDTRRLRALGRVDVFQYRKRYEITCDLYHGVTDWSQVEQFQYRKRYEITCDLSSSVTGLRLLQSFNTASGMRSHVTSILSGLSTI